MSDKISKKYKVSRREYINHVRPKLVQDILDSRSGSVCAAKTKIMNELDLEYGLKIEYKDEEAKEAKEAKELFFNVDDVQKINSTSTDTDNIDAEEQEFDCYNKMPYYILEFPCYSKTREREQIEFIVKKTGQAPKLPDGRLVEILVVKLVPLETPIGYNALIEQKQDTEHSNSTKTVKTVKVRDINSMPKLDNATRSKVVDKLNRMRDIAKELDRIELRKNNKNPNANDELKLKKIEEEVAIFEHEYSDVILKYFTKDEINNFIKMNIPLPASKDPKDMDEDEDFLIC